MLLNDPSAARELLTTALDNGWSAQLARFSDTGGSPYIVVKAVRGEDECVEVTWHTRDTGTYRLFRASTGVYLARRDVTLKQARAVVVA